MTTLTKYLLPTIMFFTYSVSHSQDVTISPQTNNIVNDLQEGNTYETAFLPEETSSKQIDNYNLLKSTASDNELKQLTGHKNGVVRVYSFMALAQRQFSGLYEIILEHIRDNELINCYAHGFEFVHSESYKRKVADFFVSTQSLTPKQRTTLDSLLIFSDQHLSYTDYLLRNIEPDEKYYTRIKQLTQKSDYNYAVIALSKFRKSDDLVLIERKIKETPYYSLEAIELFPDHYFKSVLNYYSTQSSKPYGLYAAVAAYKDSFAYNYLYHSIQEPSKNDYLREQKAKEIYGAIEKYKCPLFNELFFQLWETDFVINDSVFNYLKTIDQKRSIKLSIQSLMHPNSIDNRTLVIEDLLDFLIAVDSTSAKTVIKYNIDSANVYTLNYFVEKANHFKDIEMINSMFVRLEQTDNGHIFVPIVETILSYRDNDLNNRLLESLRANKGIKGWGLEKVIVLLDKNGLKL